MSLFLELGTFIVLWILGRQASASQLEVQTLTGRVKGTTVTIPTGKIVDVYYGIPFAQPPIGDLRFRRPRPVKPWNDVLNATIKPNACPQTIDTFFGDFPGATMWNANTDRTEDCLKLNIWVPTSNRKDFPVMIWIYGGSFFSGSSMLDIYDGKILAGEEDVIVASMNYRLGALGFLYFGREDAPGNMGLLDQTMAMQWVRDNIARFGGDPNKVTLFAESAGAASIAFQLFSPLSRNLFDRAILQSGSATASWAVSSSDRVKAHSYSLAKELGCGDSGTHLNVLMDCLKQRDADTIMEVEIPNLEFLDFGFVPVVDNYFLNKTPAEHLSDGDFKKCPLLSGSNQDEGSYFLIYQFPNDFPKNDSASVLRDRFIELLPQVQKNFVSLMRDAIVFQYDDKFGQSSKDNYLDAMDKLVGDKYFTCPVNEIMDAYVAQGVENLYMYRFVHLSSNNVWPQWMGVIHADEIAYVFGEPLIPQKNYTAEEKNFSSAIMRYWANFARSGNVNEPRVETQWPLYGSKKEYLSLDVNMVARRGIRTKQCAFWKNHFPRLLNATSAEANCQTSTGFLIDFSSKVILCNQMFILLFTFFSS